VGLPTKSQIKSSARNPVEMILASASKIITMKTSSDDGNKHSNILLTKPYILKSSN